MSLRAGSCVKFLGCSQEQIKWGSNDDPNPHLFVGDIYYVESVKVHSSHTKITLRGVRGQFNSVCFEVVNESFRKGKNLS